MYKIDNLLSKQVSKRIDYMDIFRSFGIILMVMGHIGFGKKFDYFIHAFHMPMFFFVSGFFYSRKEITFSEEVLRKAKVLLVPYFFFGVFYYVIYIIGKGFTIGPLLHLLTINTNGLVISGALWFLTALFFTDIIYFLLDRHNLKWLILPLVLIGSFADQMLPYPLPWALSASFVGLGLYWCGHKVRENEGRLTFLLNMPWWGILLFAGATIALIFLNGYINMREGKYAILPLFWVNAILSCFVGISISKVVKQWVSFCVKWAQSIGRNSIVYVCLNQLVIAVAKKIVPFEGMNGRIIILALTMVCLYGLTLAFTRTQLKMFIGKK